MNLNPFSFGRHKLWNVGWGTYFTLRTWLMVLAFALPLALWWGGELFHNLSLQGSISAYYHKGDGALRDVFVGSVIAIAALLIVYKGFSGFENWALNIGGVALVIVALVPDNRSTDIADALPWLHGGSAITFFICLAYVALVRSGDTLDLVPDEGLRDRFRRLYLIVGGLMIGSATLAGLIAWLSGFGAVVFWVETAGVWSFAVYWYFKTLEMRTSHADALAARRLLRRPGYTFRDLISTLNVEPVLSDMGETSATTS